MATLRKTSMETLTFTESQVIAGLRMLGAPLPPDGDPSIKKTPHIVMDGSRIDVRWSTEETIEV